MPRLRRDDTRTAFWREGYEEGFRAGVEYASGQIELPRQAERTVGRRGTVKPKKRKLSAWNKFVKANSKKPRFVYRNGKLNLKKMGVAFRKTPAGKKGKR